VPLRYRQKIITTPLKELLIDGATARDVVEFYEEADDQGILFEVDKPGGKVRIGGEEMAVAMIDDVVRWALEGRGKTKSFDMEDLEEVLVCQSGMCE